MTRSQGSGRAATKTLNGMLGNNWRAVFEPGHALDDLRGCSYFLLLAEAGVSTVAWVGLLSWPSFLGFFSLIRSAI